MSETSKVGATLWRLVLFATCLVLSNGQQSTPFYGQGYPPEQGVDVYVTVFLDRLLEVDNINYRFEAVLYMMLSWSDPRARPAMLNSSATAINGTCKLPCTSLYTFIAGSSSCCDGVWLPHLEFVNARGFSQDRLVRYGIRFPDDNSSDAVAWWAHVQGQFYTGLGFKAFPFDRQELFVEVAYADRTPNQPVGFHPSSTALSMYMPRAGDDLSGWTVGNLTITTFNISAALGTSQAMPSDVNDPWPINPANSSQMTFTGILWKQGFIITIYVNRTSVYYVITEIVPIVLNVLLALLIFSISPRHLDTRLGIIVTLFLSLTALMFVVATMLPMSSTVIPTQQTFILSYLILAVIAIESILTYQIVTVEKRRIVNQKTMQAYQTFRQRWDAIKQSSVPAKRSSDSEPKTPSKAGDPHAQDDVAVDVGGIEKVQDGQQHRRQDPGLHQEVSMDTRYVAFTGFSAEDDDSNSPEASRAGSFASSNSNPREVDIKGGEATLPPAPKNWFALKWRKWKEMRREMNENPDYALHIALIIDRVTFLFILASYVVIVIVLFAVGSQEQTQVRYG